MIVRQISLKHTTRRRGGRDDRNRSTRGARMGATDMTTGYVRGRPLLQSAHGPQLDVGRHSARVTTTRSVLAEWRALEQGDPDVSVAGAALLCEARDSRTLSTQETRTAVLAVLASAHAAGGQDTRPPAQREACLREVRLALVVARSRGLSPRTLGGDGTLDVLLDNPVARALACAALGVCDPDHDCETLLDFLSEDARQEDLGLQAEHRRAEALFVLGCDAYEGGDVDDARACWDEALRCGHGPSGLLLAAAALSGGEEATARSLYRRAALLAEPAAYEALAWLSSRSGEAARAQWWAARGACLGSRVCRQHGRPSLASNRTGQ